MCQHYESNTSNQQKTKILYEITELALAESASIISSLGQLPVQFRIESVDLNNKTSLDDLFNPFEPDMLAVCHSIEGAYPGNIIFLLEAQQGCNFTKVVLNDGNHLKDMSEMEEEALTEIGNIIVNNFLSHYVQVLHKPLNTQVPTLKRSHYKQLVEELSSDAEKNDFYLLQFCVEISSYKGTAYLLWLDYPCQLETAQAQTLNIEG